MTPSTECVVLTAISADSVSGFGIVVSQACPFVPGPVVVAHRLLSDIQGTMSPAALRLTRQFD